MFTLRRFSLYIVILISILVMSSFAAAQPSSPTEVAKQIFAAAEKKDAEAFKGLTCKSVRDYLETSSRKDELLQMFMGIMAMGTPDKSASISENIEGDKATVTYTKKNPDGSSESSKAKLIKDGDHWVGFCLDAKALEGFQLSDKMNSRLAAGKLIEDAQIRKDVEDFYAKRHEAFKAKDINSYKSMETDDYKFVLWFLVPGVSPRQEADESVANYMQRVKTVKVASTKVDSIKQGADENEVLVESTYTAQLTDQDGNNISGESKYRDILVRDKGLWKIKYSELVDFSQKAQ